MVQPQQVIDGSTAAPPAVVVVAADAPELTATAAASVVVVAANEECAPAPQIKPLLRKVATRARRSGLRVALGVIFVFGFASLVLTARSASFSRAWQSSFSSVRSSSAGILRSTTRTVVPVLVHHEDDQDTQLDSNATADDQAASSNALPPAPQQPATLIVKGELRSFDADETPPASAPPRYALLRVIGNALPPRHDPARTLQNLRFVLEHEHLDDADELVKHWVVNRILDPALLAQIRALLTEFGATFTEIPFELSAFAQQAYRVVIEDEGVDRVHAAPPAVEEQGDWTRVMMQNEVLDAKNRYALSVNAARNMMLAIGQRLGARWILPWDQNCFLRNDAWQRIKTDLAYQDHVAAAAAAVGNARDPHELKYFLVPMDRLVEENDAVLSPAYRPYPWEEPQVIFRADATERFDEQFRYGKRDKVALLVRLKVPGVWNNWGWSTWERARTFDNVSHDVDGVSVPQTGYVVRLYSGMPGLESDDQGAAYWRELRRGEAVVSVLNDLEMRVMRELVHYSHEALTVWNASALAAMQRVYKAKGSKGALKLLMQDAAKASVAVASRVPWTVTSNAAVGTFNHSNVFSNFVDAPDAHDDAHVMQYMAYNTTALTLAWQITGEARFADKALAALTAWCVDNATAMEPLLEFADLSQHGLASSNSNAFWVGAASGIRHLAVLPTLLDSVRLLLWPQHTSSTATEGDMLPPAAVSNATRHGVLHWMQRLYTYLQTSEHALQKFRAAPSLYGLQYDLQVAALAAFLNDSLAYRYTLGTLQGRLVTMLDAATGQLALPLGVAQTPYTMVSLATWGSALAAAQQLNMTSHLLQFDLTADGKEETTTADGGLLCRMVAAHVPCCEDPAAASDRLVEGACVKMLQDAAPVHLFIYQRLVRHAVTGCAHLAALPTCASLAQLELHLDELPAEELRRYNLAPYPYLLQQ